MKYTKPFAHQGYVICVGYPVKHREFIKKIFRSIRSHCFDCWHYPPSFKIGKETYKGSGEFFIYMTYKNPKDKENECSQGWNAIDITQAFIEGAFVARRMGNE